MSPSHPTALPQMRRAKLAALAAMFAAAACGGGGGGGGTSTPPPPPPPAADPTVSAMFVNPAALGNLQELMVTLTGTDLTQGLSVTSPQCASLTRSAAAPHASGAETAYYRCAVTPGATEVKVDALLSKDNSALGTASFTIGAPTLLAAAIAGKDAVAPDPLTGQVEVPGTAKYSQAMTVEVTGENVNQGLVFDSPDCTGMALSTAPPLVSTSTKAYYTCRATALHLTNQVAISLAGDPSVVLAPRFNVPPPQVTLSMATVDPSNSSKTALGDVIISVDPGLAPVAANNFLDYVNSGFYNGTIFHNVQTLPALIEAGRFAPTTGAPTPTQKAASAALAPELPARPSSYVKWTLAMSRNTAPADGPARFIVNMADNDLGSASAVFGTITAGQAFVQTIAGSCAGQLQCLPVPNFTIDRAVQTR
jgi:peptidyl-prolyl cis-trans isomerase A (cyclophilin A)